MKLESLSNFLDMIVTSFHNFDNTVLFTICVRDIPFVKINQKTLKRTAVAKHTEIQIFCCFWSDLCFLEAGMVVVRCSSNLSDNSV